MNSCARVVPRAKGHVDMSWDDDSEDYYVSLKS